MEATATVDFPHEQCVSAAEALRCSVATGAVEYFCCASTILVLTS